MLGFRLSFAFLIINVLIEGYHGNNITDHLCSLFKKTSYNESCVSFEDADLFKRFNELTVTFPSTSLKLIKSENLNNSTVKELLPFSPVLFHFIPAEKLKEISESAVISLLDVNNDDVSLALKLASSLSSSDYNHFLRTLSNKDISNEVWMRLMKYVTLQTHPQTNISLSSIIGRPMLFLPPEFLLQLNADQTIEYMFYLKPFGDAEEIWEVWLDKQLLLKRVWSMLFIREQYPVPLEKWNLDSFNNFNFAMQGMTLEEIDRIDVNIGENRERILSLKWNPLQFRMLFDKIEESINSNVVSMDDIQKNVFKFLPRQYEQLTVEAITELKDIIMKEDLNSVSLSLPTSLQLFELMVALEMRRNTTSVSLNKETSFSYGKLLHTRSLFTLSQFCDRPLLFSTLANLNALKLTYAQAYYITGCGLMLQNMPIDNILAFYALLKAVPASYFINIIGEQVTSSICKHLLSNLPEGNTVLSAAILEFVRPHFARESYLSDMLANPSNEYFSLISPVEIVSELHSLREILILSKERVEARAGNLPHHILMPLLHKENGLVWEDMYSAHQGNLFINGLTCDDVLSIPSADFISILSIYSKNRKQFNNVFPKDLQRCVQMAVISYLQLKGQLQEGHSYVGNVVSYMDLSDIEIIGGYILATFPVSDLFRSEYNREIISEIGSLSLCELMLVMPRSHLENITAAYITTFNNNGTVDIRNLLDLGNLTHFIPRNRIEDIDPTAFRLIIESKYIDTRVCTDAETREKWAKLLIKAFGKPDVWKSDTLLSLNDMLITLTIEDLESVNTTARLDSADIMISRYYEQMPWYTLGSQPFYQACMATFDNDEFASTYLTSVTDLIRYHLRSVQNLLRSVLTSIELLKRKNYYYSSSSEPSNNYENEKNGTDRFIPSYSPETRAQLLFIEIMSNENNDNNYATAVVYSKNGGGTNRTDRDIKFMSTENYYAIDSENKTTVNDDTESWFLFPFFPRSKENIESVSAHNADGFTTTMLNSSVIISTMTNIDNTTIPVEFTADELARSVSDEGPPIAVTTNTDYNATVDPITDTFNVTNKDEEAVTSLFTQLMSSSSVGNGYIDNDYESSRKSDNRMANTTSYLTEKEESNSKTGTERLLEDNANILETTSLNNNNNNNDHTRSLYPDDNKYDGEFTTGGKKITGIKNLSEYIKEFNTDSPRTDVTNAKFDSTASTTDRATTEVVKAFGISRTSVQKEVPPVATETADLFPDESTSSTYYYADGSAEKNNVLHTINTAANVSQQDGNAIESITNASLSTDINSSSKIDLVNNSMMETNDLLTATTNCTTTTTTTIAAERNSSMAIELTTDSAQMNSTMETNYVEKKLATTKLELVASTTENVIIIINDSAVVDTTLISSTETSDLTSSVTDRILITAIIESAAPKNASKFLNVQTNEKFDSVAEIDKTPESNLAYYYVNKTADEEFNVTGMKTAYEEYVPTNSWINLKMAYPSANTDTPDETAKVITGTESPIVKAESLLLTSQIEERSSTTEEKLLLKNFENNTYFKSDRINYFRYNDSLDFITIVPETTVLSTAEVVGNTGEFISDTDETSIISKISPIVTAPNSTNRGNSNDFSNLLSDQSITTAVATDSAKFVGNERLSNNNIDNNDFGMNKKLSETFTSINNYSSGVDNNDTVENKLIKIEEYSSLSSTNNQINNSAKLVKDRRSILVKNSDYDLNDKRIIELLKILNITSINEIKVNKRRRKSCSKKTDNKPLTTARRKRSMTDLFNSEINITCDALRSFGPVSGLAIHEADIEAMDSEEIFDCLDLFGIMNLTSVQKLMIWNSVKEKGLYHTMGNVISVVTVNELNRFNFSIHSSWALEILYLFSQHTEDPVLHSTIVDKFLDENEIYAKGKEFPTATIIALGPMICQLPSSLLQQILATPLKWSYIWSVFQRIKGCPLTCLTKLADIAVNVIGTPESWSSFNFHMLGPIPAGLKDDKWFSLIRLNSTFTSYLAPSVVPCIAPHILKALNEEQLSLLPPTSVYSLTTEQKLIFTEGQLEIINNILNMKVNKQPLRIVKKTLPSAGSLIFSNILVIILSLFICIYID